MHRGPPRYPIPVPKNIVICCDGTADEFGPTNSNVIKLYQTIVCGPEQVAYYHPGVGTMGARSALTGFGRWWTRLLGLAFGYGISDNVADAYQFLMRTWEPGDRLYLIGFSRGAYTARAVAGLLHLVGLLNGGNEALIPYAIRMARGRGIDFAVAAEFKRTFSRQCNPHFIGVWDTVTSVGWIYDAVRFAFTKAAGNPDLHIVRQAIAIDERRAFFRHNMFGAPSDPSQDIAEVWFAGVHDDVGGNLPEAETALSQIALRWMLGEGRSSSTGRRRAGGSDRVGAYGSLSTGSRLGTLSGTKRERSRAPGSVSALRNSVMSSTMSGASVSLLIRKSRVRRMSATVGWSVVWSNGST